MQALEHVNNIYALIGFLVALLVWVYIKWRDPPRKLTLFMKVTIICALVGGVLVGEGMCKGESRGGDSKVIGINVCGILNFTNVRVNM